MILNVVYCYAECRYSEYRGALNTTTEGFILHSPGYDMCLNVLLFQCFTRVGSGLTRKH
jgi:hypothetical protein